MKVLFLVPYPQGEAPSQRFRFEQYLSFLKDVDISYELHSFMSPGLWRSYYVKGKTLSKIVGMASGYLRRYLLLGKMHKFDVVFIHREASPLGPCIYAWLVTKVWKKRLIYDFDDAIWLENYSKNNKSFAWLKNYRNPQRLMKWSHINVCGNQYLKEYADRFKDANFVIPTSIDTEKIHNKTIPLRKSNLTIGWTGSHSTFQYLEPVLPVLRKLQSDIPFTLRIISNFKPRVDLNHWEFIKWNKQSETQDLLAIDVGLMPLPNEEWSKGKCGLKALQYMALGIVPIVSPVGVNKKIVTHGLNGLHAANPDEWESALRELLENSEKRMEISRHTRKVIESYYSIEANKAKFLHLFAQS